MADERPPIQSGGGGDFERAARRVLADAERATGLTDDARRKLEAERRKNEAALRRLEGKLAQGGANPGSTRAAIERRQQRIKSIDDEVAAAQRGARAIAQAEQQATRAVEEGTRRRSSARQRAARVPVAQPLPTAARRALERYTESAAYEEASSYRTRAQGTLANRRELDRLKAMAPAGYDVEAVLRRQAAAPLPPLPRGLGTAAELRDSAIAQGVNIAARPTTIGSPQFFTAQQSLRPALSSARGQRGLEDLRQRGLFTPYERPAPKATYNPAYLRQKKLEAAAAAEAAAAEERLQQARVAGANQYAAPIGPVRRPVDERAAIGGDAAEFERIARAHAERMADALDPEQRREFNATREPVAPERQAEATAELARAQEAAAEKLLEAQRQSVEKLESLTTVSEAASADSARSAVLEEVKGAREDVRSKLEPRKSAGGGGADVVRHIDETEARGEARIAKAQEAQETRRLIEAEARERNAREHATRNKLEEARQPGTAIVPRTLANAGLQTRQQLELIEASRGLPRGPLFGEYPHAPAGGRPAVGFGATPTLSGRPLQGESQREIEKAARSARGRSAALADMADQTRQNDQWEAQLNRRMAESSAGLQRWGAQLGLVDQGQRKHGALTTEFIQAAVRGEASYKEWGYQIGATAAKFAGWTAVSIPVFAALEGVRRVGEGAIASSSGVEQLQRVLGEVDGSAAQAAFRSLSGQFNMPISEVTDAIFGMGQVFHNLPDAVDAATAALYSFKVGGVDVETSTRNLNAIATGFGVQSGGELLRFFDQINQAQNQFGITIANTEAGVAKAAGTFRNAGGSFSYLLALTATGQRATGRTGENIGTAIQRSVGFIQRPQNQQALSEFGIDTSKGIEAIYTQAFDVAQRLSGEGLQRLATALSSPQYASYFVPILQNRDLFQRLRAGTSAEASRGSARRELSSVLGQLDEQIAKVGNSFERLGSALGEAGFTAPLVGAVGSMNSILSAATSLLGVFNSMPIGLRLALALMVQMRGAAAVARRFGVGEALQESPLNRLAPYLIEDPQRRARRAVTKGVNDSVGAARDEQQRMVAQAYSAAAASERATQQAREELAELEKGVADKTIDPVSAEQARTRVRERQERAAERAYDASTAATGSLRQAREQEILQAELNERLRNTPRSRRDQAAFDFARERGLPVPPSLRTDTPLAEKVQSVNDLHFDPMLGVVDPTLSEQGRPAKRVRGELARGGRKFVAGLRSDREALKRISQEWGPVAAASIGTGVVAERATNATIAAARGLRGMAGSVAGAGRALLGMIGPFELIFAGLLVIPQVYERMKNALDDRSRTLERVSVDDPTTAKGQRAQHALAVKEANRHTTLGDIGTDLGDLLHGDFSAFGSHPAAIRRQDAARAVVNAQNHLADAQRRAGDAGRARAGLTMKPIFAAVDEDYRAFDAGRITLAELRERTDTRLKEVNEGVGSKGAKHDARSRINARFGATGSAKDFYTRVFGAGGLDEVSASIYDDQAAGLQALMEAGTASDRQVQQHQAVLLAVMAQTRGKGDRKSRERYAEASQAFVQGIDSVARGDLDRALSLARGQDERDAAYREYAEKITGTAGLNNLLRTRRGQVREAKEGRGDSQERVKLLTRARDQALARGDVRGAYRAFQLIGDERQRQDGYQATIDRAKGEGKAIRGAYKDTAGPRKELAEAIRREQFEDQRAFREAQTGVQVGRQDAGAPRIRFQLRRIGDEIRRAIRVYGRRSKEVLALVSQQQDLQNQAVDEQETTIDSVASYNAASAGSDAGEAAANLRGLQQKLAHRIANPRRYSANDVRDVRTQILQAQKQQAEQVRQDAVDLIGARFDYLSSLTDNPVELARLQEQQAGATLAQGGFKNAAERYQALAAVNNARRQREQAVADRRIENLDYEHDIGKLTDDAYIRSLEAVMGDMKKGSEARRQLRMRIGRLKHDIDQGGDFELNVGDIRLPSLYEIRRAVVGRQRGQSVTQNRNNVTINVSKDTDMGAFASALETHLSGSGRATLRSVGMR